MKPLFHLLQLVVLRLLTHPLAITHEANESIVHDPLQRGLPSNDLPWLLQQVPNLLVFRDGKPPVSNAF